MGDADIMLKDYGERGMEEEKSMRKVGSRPFLLTEEAYNVLSKMRNAKR